LSFETVKNVEKYTKSVFGENFFKKIGIFFAKTVTEGGKKG